jgi:hypothetical protein
MIYDQAMIYDKSEFGWMIFVLFLPIVVFLPLAYVYQWGNHPLPLFPMIGLTVFLIFIVSLFYQLRIIIKDRAIHLIYGIGLVKETIRPERINELTLLKTPWYYGLGIRFTPMGILYNIHSLKAVKIDCLKRGRQKTVLIGTPDPEELRNFLLRRFKIGTIT